MKYILGIAVALISLFFFQDNSDIKFSDLTFRMIGNNLLGMWFLWLGFNIAFKDD